MLNSSSVSISTPTSSFIILVEDDAELASLVSDYLSRQGYTVETVSRGDTAEALILNRPPDLLILDVMLPGKSGMDICRDIRPHYHGPILMLTALDEDFDQMLGLELGADDYIIKPVQPRVLLARIRALLRRVSAHSPTIEGVLEIGTLRIDLSNRVVTLNGIHIGLNTSEFDLLRLLAEHAGEPVSRDTIVQKLRGFEYDGLDRAIDRRVSRLRKNLAQGASTFELIKTIRGKGYQLCPQFAVSGKPADKPDD